MSDVISSLAFISLPELPVEGCVFVEHSYKLPPPHLLMLSTNFNVFLLHTPVQLLQRGCHTITVRALSYCIFFNPVFVKLVHIFLSMLLMLT